MTLKTSSKSKQNVCHALLHSYVGGISEFFCVQWKNLYSREDFMEYGNRADSRLHLKLNILVQTSALCYIVKLVHSCG
jgi:hypothetical protein